LKLAIQPWTVRVVHAMAQLPSELAEPEPEARQIVRGENSCSGRFRRASSTVRAMVLSQLD
jgi:hypothetical protein